jgi:hypothetical protein
MGTEVSCKTNLKLRDADVFPQQEDKENNKLKEQRRSRTFLQMLPSIGYKETIFAIRTFKYTKSVAMFVIFNIRTNVSQKYIHMFMTCPHTKSHMSSSLFVAIKPILNIHRFREAAMLLFFTLYENTILVNAAYFSGPYIKLYLCRFHFRSSHGRHVAIIEN